MSKLESIYLQAVRKRSLRDNIPVEELPKSVQAALENSNKSKDTLQLLRQRDNGSAKVRLELLKQQLAALKTKK